ncbi:MAG: glycosyltransferase [Cyanobacteria bacterium SBLK]|nr:glycosyltransferase [Cyanobacteria bacterium SBLK]
MSKYYIFFVGETLPTPAAHLVQITNCANAAANLGYPALLVYLQKDWQVLNPFPHLFSFRAKRIDETLKQFYNLQDKLQVLPLPIPPFSNRVGGKFANSNTIACKYYFPFQLRHQAGLVHSRDWNFIKAAVSHGIPAIYEKHHLEQKQYEPEIVNSPLFKISVTIADPIIENLLENGMPSDKVVKFHNGYNQSFFERKPEAAIAWRKGLLGEKYRYLAAYAGALTTFKGIDLLLEIAPDHPEVLFALAGGPEQGMQAYRDKVKENQIDNVILLGFLPQIELAGLLQAADILLYPHLSGEAARWTSPLKLFDYIAVGKPIVSTRIVSLQEFFSSSLITHWCEPDRPQDFSRALEQALEQYPQWAIESIHPPELIAEYSWEHRIAKILERVSPSKDLSEWFDVPNNGSELLV